MHQIKGQQMVYGHDEEIDLEKKPTRGLEIWLISHYRLFKTPSADKQHLSLSCTLQLRRTVQIWRWKSTICTATAAECQKPVQQDAPRIHLCNIKILSSNSDDEKQVLNQGEHMLNIACMLIILATEHKNIITTRHPDLP